MTQCKTKVPEWRCFVVCYRYDGSWQGFVFWVGGNKNRISLSWIAYCHGLNCAWVVWQFVALMFIAISCPSIYCLGLCSSCVLWYVFFLLDAPPPQFLGSVKKCTVVLIGVVAASLAAEDIASYSIMVHALKRDVEDDWLNPGSGDVRNVFQFLFILFFCSSNFLINIVLCQTSCPLRTVHCQLISGWEENKKGIFLIEFEPGGDLQWID